MFISALFLKISYCSAKKLLIPYNIKKKEEIQEPQMEEPANPLMRKKKTPEELAREAEEAEADEFTNRWCPCLLRCGF